MVTKYHDILYAFAQKHNANYSINGDEENLLYEATRQESIYLIRIPYKGHEIYIEYIMGAMHTGTAYVLIQNDLDQFKFEITTRSPFATLFLGKKDRVKIKTSDLGLRTHIKSNKYFQNLNKLSEHTGFEPLTIARVRKEGYSIRTSYHLRFPERTKELEDLVGFYKALVDYIAD